LKSAW